MCINEITMRPAAVDVSRGKITNKVATDPKNRKCGAGT